MYSYFQMKLLTTHYFKTSVLVHFISFIHLIKHQSSRREWLTPVLSHHRTCRSAYGGSSSLLRAITCLTRFSLPTVYSTYSWQAFGFRPTMLNVIALFSWFSSILHIHAYNPNYATRLDVCPFAPSTFIDFFATTSRTDFCQTNNTLQCCLHFISHAILTDLPR